MSIRQQIIIQRKLSKHKRWGTLPTSDLSHNRRWTNKTASVVSCVNSRNDDKRWSTKQSFGGWLSNIHTITWIVVLTFVCHLCHFEFANMRYWWDSAFLLGVCVCVCGMWLLQYRYHQLQVPRPANLPRTNCRSVFWSSDRPTSTSTHFTQTPFSTPTSPIPSLFVLSRSAA